MRTVVGKPCWGGHSAECPKCKQTTLVTGPPCEIKCGCGETFKVKWWRYGDPVINIENS